MVLLGACTSLGPLSLNLYLPAITAVQSHFGASVAEVQSTVSLALLAFGLGLVLLGPLTDRYGRRPCLLGGLMLFMAGSTVAALATSLQMLAMMRILQSVGCAITFISARAVVADVSPKEELARSVAQMTMIMLVVQMMAPMLGNLIMSVGGWRAIQCFGSILAAGLLLGIALAQPETLLGPSAGDRLLNFSYQPCLCWPNRAFWFYSCRWGCSIQPIPHSSLLRRI
jgi:DHA1 family bicyclomycin/chloramphenicol resistance-like MFS transporter